MKDNIIKIGSGLVVGGLLMASLSVSSASNEIINPDGSVTIPTTISQQDLIQQKKDSDAKIASITFNVNTYSAKLAEAQSALTAEQNNNAKLADLVTQSKAVKP